MIKKQITNEHNFYEYTMNNYKNEVEWAKETAMLKVKNTVDSWQKRTDCKRFTNLFLGDLAKNIVKRFIQDNIQNIEKNILEYDLLRQDEFKYPDKFDLKIQCNNRECNIEVKSSGEKFTSNLIDIYNNRRIIINIGNEHSHVDCIYMQVMFIPDDLTFFENDDIKECSDFEKFVDSYMCSFSEMNIKAYITGYANEKMQIAAINQTNTFNIQNSQAGAKKRKYAELIIKDSKCPDALIENTKKFCSKEIGN